MHGFWAGRKSLTFQFWAAPAAGKPLPKGGPLRCQPFRRDFPAAGAPQTGKGKPYGPMDNSESSGSRQNGTGTDEFEDARFGTGGPFIKAGLSPPVEPAHVASILQGGCDGLANPAHAA
jgi:hypothetical protein